MNELILSGSGEKRMTSLEISELVESRHDNVRTTIERLASRAVIELPAMQEISTATKPVKVYLLDKRSSLIVVAQLSPEFTARVVDRWQELEAQAVFQIPTTLPDALRLAADLADQKMQLEATIATQAPLVELATKIDKVKKGVLIGNFAKAIGLGRNRVFAILKNIGLLDRNNAPLQRYIDCGWFEVREGTYENVFTNGPRACFTTLVTGRGQIAISKKVDDYIRSKENGRNDGLISGRA